MVERSYTNNIEASESFTNWDNSGTCDISLNEIVAPDGTTTGAKLTERARSAGQNCRWLYTYSISAGVSPHTFSIYIKEGSGDRFVHLNLGGVSPGFFDSQVVYDPSDQSFSNPTISGSGNFEDGFTQDPNQVWGAVDCGNGWYRVFLKQTYSATPTSIRCGVYISDNASSVAYDNAVAGTSYIYIWGAQCEASDLPHTYVKTTGTPVTSTAGNLYTEMDVFSGTGGALDADQNGTLLTLVKTRHAIGGRRNSSRQIRGKAGDTSLFLGQQSKTEIRLAGWSEYVPFSAKSGTARFDQTDYYVLKWDTAGQEMYYNGTWDTRTNASTSEISQMYLGCYGSLEGGDNYGTTLAWDRELTRAEVELLISTYTP